LRSDLSQSQRESEQHDAANHSEDGSQSLQMESDSYPFSNYQSLQHRVHLRGRDHNALPQLDLSNHLNGLRLLAMATATNPLLMEHVVAVATCLPLSTTLKDQPNQSEF